MFNSISSWICGCCWNSYSITTLFEEVVFGICVDFHKLYGIWKLHLRSHSYFFKICIKICIISWCVFVKLFSVTLWTINFANWLLLGLKWFIFFQSVFPYNVGLFKLYIWLVYMLLTFFCPMYWLLFGNIWTINFEDLRICFEDLLLLVNGPCYLLHVRYTANILPYIRYSVNLQF